MHKDDIYIIGLAQISAEIELCGFTLLYMLIF